MDGHQVDADSLAAFADVAVSLYASEVLDEALARLTGAAVRVIEGCEMASVSLLEHKRIRTAGATDPVAEQGDRIQYATGQGPCLEAAIAEQLVHTPDLATDERWPEFSRRVCAELEVRSMLAVRLQVARGADGAVVLGALNMYALTPDAFSDDDMVLATLLASHSALIIDASMRQASLRAAMESRDVIGQAKGILMERYKISNAEAFARLRTASQSMNKKLHELAETLATTGEDPTRPAG